MRRFIVVFVLLLLSMQVFPQFSIYSEYFSYNKKTEVYPVTTSPELGLPMIFVSDRNVKIIYLDSDYKLVNEIRIKKSLKDYRNYIGSYFADSSLVMSFRNKHSNAMSHVIVDLHDGSYIEVQIDNKIENQKYLASWEIKDSLIVLSVVEGSNDFVVSKYFDGGSLSVNEFDVETQIADNSLFDFFSTDDGNIQKVDNTIPVSLQIASAKNKVYLVKDKVYITFDGDGVGTRVIMLDLHTGMFKDSYYDYHDEQLVTVGNSFIYDNKLFALSIDKLGLALRISCLVDSSNDAVFIASKDRSIDFKNSNFIERNEKEGFLFGDPVVTEIGSFRKFLRIVSKMNPAISVFSKLTDYQILMGGIVGIHQSAGVTSNIILSSGGNMKVNPGGSLTMPDPVYNFATNYSFSSYSSFKSAYFSSIVDSESCDHKQKQISKYTYDYIIEYANYMAGRYGLVTVFKMSGDYYLGYYSYKNSTYNIEWFKNIDDFSVQY